MPDRSQMRTHRRGAAGDWPGRPGPIHGAAHETPAGREADRDAEVEQLRAELEAAEAKAAEQLAALQRTAADFANYRRRTNEDRERDLGLASEALLRKLLPIADDFDRALESVPDELRKAGWIEGIVLLDRKLRSLLESEGVTPIEAVGKPFDPREHDAITTVPGTGRPDGEVVAEIQRGYRVRDRVLRPAMVAVAGGDQAAGDNTSEID